MEREIRAGRMHEDGTPVEADSRSHTPGPWIAHPEGVKDADGKPACNRIYIGIAAEDGEDLGHIEFSEANARLIAAAPQLLEALQDAMQYLQHHLPESALAPHRAAIAAATGEA